MGKGNSRRNRDRPVVGRSLRSVEAGAFLGDFGTPVESGLDASFGYMGEQVRVNPELSELAYIDFVEAGTNVAEDDPRSVTMLKDHFRALIHPGDFETFWKLAQKNRQTLSDLMTLEQGLLSALTARPTSRPVVSSAGPANTQERSEDGDYEAALLQFRGRPDKASALVRRHLDLVASRSG